MSNRISKSLTVAAFITIGTLLAVWLKDRPIIHRKWRPMVYFSQIETNKPFYATVQSVHHGFVDQQSTGALAYVIAFVKKGDGEEIGLYQENPTTNLTAILDSLIVGKAYEFPITGRTKTGQQ